MKLRLLIYIFLICSTLYGQTVFIKNVKLYFDKSEFIIHPQMNDFFDDTILGAVNSGMNVTFHFYSELYDVDANLVKEQENQIHVRNDIWENHYTITAYKFYKNFTEFDRFKKFLLDSLQFKLETGRKITENKKLQIFLTFSPQKISTSQKEKIRSWLKNEDEDSESVLSINLSKLISFFITEDKNNNLDIFKSEIFTLKSLKSNESTP